MGTIDQTTHTLKCQCGAVESATAFQKGSAYGGGSWQLGKQMIGFEIMWKQDDFAGPSISSAVCKQCGGFPVATTSQ